MIFVILYNSLDFKWLSESIRDFPVDSVVLYSLWYDSVPLRWNIISCRSKWIFSIPSNCSYSYMCGHIDQVFDFNSHDETLPEKILSIIWINNFCRFLLTPILVQLQSVLLVRFVNPSVLQHWSEKLILKRHSVAQII